MTCDHGAGRPEESMSSCTFDATDTSNFPYNYRYANNTLVKTGTIVNDICVFDVGYQCSSQNNCCEVTDQVANDAQVWIVPMICFFGPYVLLRLAMRFKPDLFADKDANASEEEKEQEKKMVMTRMFEGKSDCYKYTLMFIFMAMVVVQIGEAQIMPQSIQHNLSPADRAAQLTISLFLTPIAEIFAFIEDTMTVKVGYAMALNQFSRLNSLLHISVIGGLVSGIVAFLAMLVTALNDSSASAILNPYADTNAVLIEGGCSLIPTTDDLLKSGRIYWILLTAAWIPNFATKGISGFLIGTGEFMVYFIPGIVFAIVPITVLFTLLSQYKDANIDLHPIEILGVAYGVDAWLITLFFVGFLCYRSDIREKYNLHWLCGSQKQEVDQGEAEEDTASTSEVFKETVWEGLELMVVDLAVQLSKTITIYVAASQGFEEVYKIASVDAAYWNFGPAYIVAMFTILKMMGAQLIANGKHAAFIRFYYFFIIITFSLGIGAIVVAYLRQNPVAFEYAQSACVYATSEGCSTVYKNIFKGDNALHSVFAAFGPTVLLNMLFGTLRQGLATCHDFSFLAKASTAIFVLIYTPSILVARYSLNTAVAYYVAMYMPHFVMVVVFGYRMMGHLSKLNSGQPGPWTEHASATPSAEKSVVIHSKDLADDQPVSNEDKVADAKPRPRGNTLDNKGTDFSVIV